MPLQYFWVFLNDYFVFLFLCFIKLRNFNFLFLGTSWFCIIKRFFMTLFHTFFVWCFDFLFFGWIDFVQDFQNLLWFYDIFYFFRCYFQFFYFYWLTLFLYEFLFQVVKKVSHKLCWCFIPNWRSLFSTHCFCLFSFNNLFFLGLLLYWLLRLAAKIW